MNEKLLSTTVETLDENELKKIPNSIYGACGIAYARPTCMTDQDWMNIGAPYLVPLDSSFTREDILKIVGTMIEKVQYPYARNLRVLAGARIMVLLSRIPGEVPDRIVCGEITFVYDKWMKPREMQLQRKRVTMRYDQFFKPKLFDIHKDVCSVNELASYIINSVANLKGVFKGIFNLEENNMSKKSLEVKKVIYSGPCTIVIWADDSKTIVRCQDGDTYSKEVGLLMCLAKKVWGTNTSGSNFNDYISKFILEKEENE